MMKLFDKSVVPSIGEISEKQFKILPDAPEEKSRSDNDYDINRAIVDNPARWWPALIWLGLPTAALRDCHEMDMRGEI